MSGCHKDIRQHRLSGCVHDREGKRCSLANPLDLGIFGNVSYAVDVAKGNAGTRHGKSNRAIGLLLFISESTVKSHLKTLFVKLDVTSRAEAIALAAKRGFVKF